MSPRPQIDHIQPQLLGAAAEVISERGVEVRIADIAERAGTRPPPSSTGSTRGPSSSPRR